ncbi:MAG: nitroreductase family protein [Bacteroidaceae bacterium]|nr:nitroreductase family protein [Bacteroidaceae bacterium]
MTFKELCEARYSVRSYKDEEIPAEKLEYIKECARLAPSAVNKQPWRLRLITSESGLKKVCATYNREWIKTAKAVIMVIAQKDEAWIRGIDGKYHGDIDAAIITEHICLAAAEQGLGTCWVCNFDAALCHKEFGLAGNEEAVVLIPLGVPADNRPEKKRKAMDDIWAEDK